MANGRALLLAVILLPTMRFRMTRRQVYRQIGRLVRPLRVRAIVFQRDETLTRSSLSPCQSTPSAVTLYSVQDRSEEWEIKCRGSRVSRKGANALVTGGSFSLGDNEVVLVSRPESVLVYIETKRQWKKGQTLKHPVGSFQALPDQRLAMLIGLFRRRL